MFGRTDALTQVDFLAPWWLHELVLVPPADPGTRLQLARAPPPVARGVRTATRGRLLPAPAGPFVLRPPVRRPVSRATSLAATGDAGRPRGVAPDTGRIGVAEQAAGDALALGAERSRLPAIAIARATARRGRGAVWHRARIVVRARAGRRRGRAGDGLGRRGRGRRRWGRVGVGAAVGHHRRRDQAKSQPSGLDPMRRRCWPVRPASPDHVTAPVHPRRRGPARPHIAVEHRRGSRPPGRPCSSARRRTSRRSLRR